MGRRGPDALHTLTVTITDSDVITTNPIRLTFIAGVLFIRGTKPTPQPYGDDNGNLLLWNGEIFGGIDVCISYSFLTNNLNCM